MVKKRAVKKKSDEESVDFFEDTIKRAHKGTTIKGATEYENPDPNSTGSITLDDTLGTPFPEGKIVEVFGAEGSCKTALTLQAIATALMAGKDCLFINLEGSLSKDSLNNISTMREALPLHADKFKVLEAPYGEAALESMRIFAQQYPKSLIVLDSVDACVPEVVLSGEIGDRKVGNLPQLMSDALRKLSVVVKDTGSTMVFINQVREKIGVMYGDPNVSSGGRALKFYATQRIKLLPPGKAQKIIQDGEEIGFIMRYNIVKNRFGKMGADGEIPIIYREGFFTGLELIEKSLALGVLKFGGRGGKQVLLPILKDGEVLEEVVYKKMSAGRRISIDKNLKNYLLSKVEEIAGAGIFQAAEDFMAAEDED